jgi:Ala-tRNA(Pro) deacylase
VGSEELLAFLEELKIECTTTSHPPVFTVEQARQLRGKLPGAHTKSILLRDKNRKLWLVVVLATRRLDLRSLRHRLDARKSLSLASPELLMESLGVEPGSVSPLALVRDREARRITLVMDEALREATHLNFHPLRNDRTTTLGPEGFQRFLEALDYVPVWLDFGPAEFEPSV